MKKTMYKSPELFVTKVHYSLKFLLKFVEFKSKYVMGIM